MIRRSRGWRGWAWGEAFWFSAGIAIGAVQVMTNPPTAWWTPIAGAIVAFPLIAWLGARLGR